MTWLSETLPVEQRLHLVVVLHDKSTLRQRELLVVLLVHVESVRRDRDQGLLGDLRGNSKYVLFHLIRIGDSDRSKRAVVLPQHVFYGTAS